MNSGLKQRLVGAIVLVCAGLILWPLLFSQTAGPRMDKQTQIPPMPEFDKFVVAEPARPANIQPVKPDTPETAPPVDRAPPVTQSQKPSPSTPAAPAKPALDAEGIPEGWLLQVASFSASKNAEQLKQQLQQQGYKAFIRQVKTANGSVERVYIGPRMSKDAFDKDRAAIDKRYKVKSIVVEYQP